MTTVQLAKPNYEAWVKHATWHFNATAFLLNGIDPNAYKSIRLNHTNIPPEFEQARQTRSLLDSIPWKDQYKDFYLKNYGVTPPAMIAILAKRGVEIPTQLHQLVEEHYQHELIQIRAMLERNAAGTPDIMHDQESVIGNRERNNYLKAIGLLTALLIDEKIKSSKNPQLRLSASQIARLIMEKAETLELDASGLKSIDRKITEAVELLNQEGKTAINL